MAFPVSRSSSPTQDLEDQSLQPGSIGYSDSPKSDQRPRLEILLDSDFVTLKGTGTDVEPARLSGHVALYLAESTSIKEITLQFRGKAKLPAPGHDVATSGHSVTYILCTHDWSFLEGHRKHFHTAKGWTGGLFPEALEYQQTLEIENTWPEKIMYSIMAGDILTAQVKFAPLSKGIRVLTVNSTVVENVKVRGRTHYPDAQRTVCATRHEIQNGHAILVSASKHTPSTSSPGTPAVATPGTLSSAGNGYFHTAPTTPSASIGSSSPLNLSQASSPSTSYQAGPSVLATHMGEYTEEDGDRHDDVVAFVNVAIPSSAMPSHGLDPITITHRIRWNILISNPDGHTSELRCSLPIHILDHSLLKEARAHSAATRRLLIGGPEVQAESEEIVELPSYNAHIRDRVANMYLPEAATMRVTNPWVVSGISPTLPTDSTASLSPEHRSGAASPLEPGTLSDMRSLDWVNSELLISLAHERRLDGAEALSTPIGSRPTSRPTSRGNSRPGSRAPSPDRYTSRVVQDMYVHGGKASRSMGSLFSTSMKPFTSLHHPSWFLHRSHSHHHHTPPGIETALDRSRDNSRSSPLVPLQRDPRDVNGLHHSFTAVPNYDIAAQGFLGGVPPLSSMRGLPSDSNLARTFSRAISLRNTP
ncbi:hypothetical protein DL96DRAFT_1603061 [Flagelloscypha sp. PMI_526]|nr:hypothetical protein DL96DRAFT_1603061 [Flagelloscypha sp. PMI_526]